MDASPPFIAQHAQMLANRVHKRFRHLRRTFERRNVGAFRLYDRDIPEVRAAVDWYEGHLVVAEYARTQTDVPGYLEALGAAVAKALDVPGDRLHLKRRRTGTERYERLDHKDQRFPVREGELKFLVELDDRIDTGLFLDHRTTRAAIRADARGARFLNLFGYTGAFTVAAIAGGANASTTVDSSATYLRWAHDNLALNNLAGPSHEGVRDDVRAFLDHTRFRYTLAVLDPPTTSTRPNAPDLDVQRDHRDLVLATLNVLSPGGVLWFSTNHQRFEPALDDLPVRSIAERTEDTVPEDFRNRTAHRCWRMVAP